jgi:hypothetical protein
MGDRLKQSRQPFGDSLDMRIELEIGAACRLREPPKGAFSRIRAALLE